MKTSSLVIGSIVSLFAVACVVEGDPSETDLLYSRDQSGLGDELWAKTSAILSRAEAAGAHVFHPAAELAAAGDVTEWIACDVTDRGIVECACGGQEDCKVLVGICAPLDTECNPKQTSCTCDMGDSPQAADAILRAAEAQGGHVFHTDPELAAAGEVLEWIGCNVLPDGSLVCICVGREDCKILKGACGDEYWDCNGDDQTECVCLPE